MSGSTEDGWRRAEQLVMRAEASVEAMEKRFPDGRWAMTAFSRHRVCELLDLPSYKSYDGELHADPAGVFDAAARCVDGIEVPIEDLNRRLALGEVLRSVASDIRAVLDARDV